MNGAMVHPEKTQEGDGPSTTVQVRQENRGSMKVFRCLVYQASGSQFSTGAILQVAGLGTKPRWLAPAHFLETGLRRQASFLVAACEKISGDTHALQNFLKSHMCQYFQANMSHYSAVVHVSLEVLHQAKHTAKNTLFRFPGGLHRCGCGFCFGSILVLFRLRVLLEGVRIFPLALNRRNPSTFAYAY
jgi:hypothetical protein